MVAALDPASQTPAASIVKRSQLSRDALAALDSGANLRGLLDDLLGRGLPADALTVIAQSLPKRYVVAWACDCLKTVTSGDPKAGPKSNDLDRAGLSLAQATT